jgi:hypothetical protein
MRCTWLCPLKPGVTIPLHYTIMLRCVGRRELMLDALLLKEAFNM